MTSINTALMILIPILLLLACSICDGGLTGVGADVAFNDRLGKGNWADWAAPKAGIMPRIAKKDKN